MRMLEAFIVIALVAGVAFAKPRKVNIKIVRPDTTITTKLDTTVYQDSLLITNTYNDTSIFIKADTLPLQQAKTKKKVKL